MTTKENLELVIKAFTRLRILAGILGVICIFSTAILFRFVGAGAAIASMFICMGAILLLCLPLGLSLLYKVKCPFCKENLFAAAYFGSRNQDIDFCPSCGLNLSENIEENPSDFNK